MTVRPFEEGNDEVRKLLERGPDPEIQRTEETGVSEPEYREYIAESNRLPNYGPDF